MSLKNVQRRLMDLGYTPGPFDGVMGPKTAAAIRAFQRDAGLAVDGIVGPKTRAALQTTIETDVPDAFPWMQEAYRLLGTREIRGSAHNADILAWADALDIDYTRDETPWCGLFVAHALATGLPKEDLADPPLWSRAWLKTGEPVDEPVFGDVLVFWRGSRDGWTGHVGFYVGEAGDYFLVLGGNQSNSVSIAKIAKNRLLGIRRPLTAAVPSQDEADFVLAANGSQITSNEA